MDDGELFDRALRYSELAQHGELSPSAKEDVERIIGRLVFELSYRENPNVGEL